MTRHNLSIKNIKQPIQQATIHPWIEKLARFGYAAKGMVYFIIGLLAARVAFGFGGKTTDSSGALVTVVTQPFGKFLLSIITVGIIGYVLWRLVQAIVDPEHIGREVNIKRIAQRIGYILSAFAYMGLAITAVKLVMGSGSSNNNSTQDWTARFLAQPFGQWLVGSVGAIVIGVGIFNLYKAYRGTFRKDLKWQQMSSLEKTWVMRIGKFGIAARGIVFSVIGVFLTQAALKFDPSQAKGLGEALAALAQQPFGRWILGVVALGLISYSLYELVEARYRQFPK